MKRQIFVLIIALLITISIPLQQAAIAAPSATSTVAQSSVPAASDVTAASAMLVDANTGHILWQKNSLQKRSMASTTKIMTAMVAIKHGNLDDTVTVSRNVLGPGRLGGIWLVPGEKVKLRDLLYALLLPSANDAAVAIAEHVGGSVEGFAALMNKEAASISAWSTNFTNPHGLDNRMHYSTAKDMAIIGMWAMADPTFSEIIGTKSWRLSRANPKLPAVVTNKNKLLYSYPGAIGGKTGYTRKAANCLVSSATRGDKKLVCVVLGVSPRKLIFEESAALLDYGFSIYKEKPLISTGRVYQTIGASTGQKIDLVAAQDVSAVLADTVPLSVEMTSTPQVELPVKKGTVLGKIIVSQPGRVVATSDLVAQEDVEAPVIEQPTLSQLTSSYWPGLMDDMFSYGGLAQASSTEPALSAAGVTGAKDLF